MSLSQLSDILRKEVNENLDPFKRAEYGQYLTSASIARFMASLFDNFTEGVRVLDPGCGVGSLLTSFLEEIISTDSKISRPIHADAYEIDNTFLPYLKINMDNCKKALSGQGIKLKERVQNEDFILSACELITQETNNGGFNGIYSHVVMNPPYRKMKSSSCYTKALRSVGIEAVNLYAAFLALGIKLLRPEGQLVAIIPRSFSNGPYYKGLRRLLHDETTFKHIHLFNSRKVAFSDDKVLQENIILKCVKSTAREDIVITKSDSADINMQKLINPASKNNVSYKLAPYDRIFVQDTSTGQNYIAIDIADDEVIEKMDVFSSSLTDLGLEVSTGPVVDFRLSKFLRENITESSAPLLFPSHFNGKLQWPISNKKPNAIEINEKTFKSLMCNSGSYVVTRRFSTKEESRRIIASLYHSSLPSKLIGFDNKLNVFHIHRSGFDMVLAKGLAVFLSSSLLDLYYRQFGGHTQVNATDLRSFRYPSYQSLVRMGHRAGDELLTQEKIDLILEDEIVYLRDCMGRSSEKMVV